MAPKTIFILFTIALALGIPRIAHAAGEPGGATTNIDVTLMLDGKRNSETWINLSAGGTLIEIPAPPVLTALRSLVAAETIRDLERQMTPQGTLTNKILSRYGITLSINAPRRLVYLETRKAATPPAAAPNPAPAPPRTAASPAKDSVRKSGGAPQEKDASGPWASPAVPALPGSAGDSVPKAAQARRNSPGGMPQGNGSDWEPLKSDSLTIGGPSPTAAHGGANPAAAAAPAPHGAPPAPELQTYRLDKTREELFEEVFKHKEPPLPPSVEVNLLVDGKSYGTLWILYNNEQKRYTFPVDPVLNALQGLVRQDLWDKLAQRAKLQTRFTVEDLIACGFPTVLNTSVFELSTGVPAQLLGTKIHPLSGQAVDPYTVPAYKPGRFTSFLNVRARKRIPYYQYNASADSAGRGQSVVDSRNEQSADPYTADLDGAVNLMTWVVEGKGAVLENPSANTLDFRRQDVRLVHDWPRQALRFNLGDLIFPTTGFQGFLKMGGVGLSRDFSLQPHLVAYPVKEFEFFLTNPSEVKIFINGALRGTYQLEQGTHDLKNFPFTVGESDVEVQITDNTGQTQTLSFNFIHEPSLLAQGKSAFTYNIGFPSRDVFNAPALPENSGRQVVLNYEYDVANPVLFLEYRRGMSNFLTLETYSQAMDTAGILGFGLLKALKIGKIKSDLAGSYHHRDAFDWAGNLEYTYIPKITSDVSPTSWRVKSEYIGKKFFRPGQDPTLLGALAFDGSFQKYSQMINLSLGASYAMRFDSVDFYSVSAGLSRNWPKGISSSLTLKNTFDRVRSTNTSVAATLNYYFNFDVQSVNASERVENHQPNGIEEASPPNWDYSTDLAWDYNGSSTFPHNPVLNMTTSFGPLSNDYSAKAQWNGNQGIAQIMARRYEPKSSYIVSNFMDLSLQTSLVYIDGNFAFSRPIQNSFIMAKGIENEKKCDILINPNDMGYDAQGSNWLPGVVPNVSPYYLKKIHIEVVDPPLGSTDERTDYTIYPGYKSGYVFYMGSKSTIIALGTLMLDSGTPAEYQAFQAIPLDGDSRDPVAGFTNKVGKFQLTRLQPGKYRIEMFIDGKTFTTDMFLPEISNGIRAVGTLLLSPK